MATWTETEKLIANEVNHLVNINHGQTHLQLVSHIASWHPQATDEEIETVISNMVMNGDIVRIRFKVPNSKTENRFYLPSGTAFYFEV